jgi:hypothetical protein
MNHLSKKLNVMEEKAVKLFNPTYEGHVANYLRLVFDRDRDVIELDDRYLKVKKTVPKMH